MTNLRKIYIGIAIVILSILIGIAILIGSLDSGDGKEGGRQAEVNKERAATYLANKYVEEMVIIEGHTSYIDSTIYYNVIPENNPDYKFRVYCGIPPETNICDDYLTTYSEKEITSIIQPVIDEHYKEVLCYSILRSEIDSLQNYYNLNKKPLSWYADEHLENLDTLVIKLYKDIEGEIEVSTLLDLANDIQNKAIELGVDIKEISIFIYKDKKSKEYDEHFYFVLINDKYEYRTKVIL